MLRRATNEPSFSYIDPITASQVRTNLANGLNSLGRTIAANEQWVTTLRAVPRFAKAFANRAQGLAYFARTVYDHGHAAVLLAAARASYDSALSEDAFWESDDRKIVAPQLTEERQQIASLLSRIQYDDDFDLNQWSLGSTATERSYRSWCLRECLFLNPLNEACTSSVAATDILHLPNHSYKIGEAPRFPAYYNIMKQEYIGARYRLFCAIHKDDPNFIMRDVLMLDSGEGQCLGHYTEDLRSSFRGAYSIFDKIALFMNDYYHLGLRPKAVTFKGIWFERTNSASQSVRSIFNSRQNLPLRGLYFLSKDLHDSEFVDASEPDAADLAILRHQLEHRFLSLQTFGTNENTETHRVIPIKEFEIKTLRLLKLAREALIYLSLAVHREEILRSEQRENVDNIGFPFTPSKIESFQRY